MTLVTPIGDAVEALGLDLYLRLPPLKSLGVAVGVFGHSGPPLYRFLARVYCYAYLPLAWPLAKLLVVKRVTCVLLFLLVGPLLYPVVMPTGPGKVP